MVNFISLSGWKNWWSAQGERGDRSRRQMRRGISRLDRLESRELLSTLAGPEAPVAAEVALASPPATPRAERLALRDARVQSRLTVPDVHGTWSITASAAFDGTQLGPYTGSVSITQRKGAVTGNVQLTGLPALTFRGRFNPSTPNLVTGRIGFPLEILPGRFLNLGINLPTQFNLQERSFSASASRTIFGHTFSFNISGSQQPT